MDFFNQMSYNSIRTQGLIDMQLSYENLLTLNEKLYQKEIIFNKLLPYADKIDDEADKLLEAIKSNLGKCVMQRNIYPGCFYWTEMLHKYLIIYGLRFTKSEHISLIKLMFELVTIPNLDAFLVKKFAKLLIDLLKKKELISPDELELPWKPLYKICDAYLHNNTKQYNYFYRSPTVYKEILKNLVSVSKIYFSVSATSEIMNELKPQICPFDKKNMNIVMKLFSWFLPVELPIKYHKVSHLMWLTDFMNIWESCNNSPDWETDLMSLISHLAANNVGTITWTEHIPLMFARFLHAFNIPANSKGPGSYKQKRKLNMIDAARWTASVIGCHKESSIHLAALVRMITPCLSPSLLGEWTAQMKKFIFFTIHFFVVRLRNERHRLETWQEEHLEEFKLTEADIDEFVDLMIPTILSSINNMQNSMETEMSLKLLALLRPNVVIPKVLEIFYPNVGETMEKYKLFTGTCCLESVSRPLVMGARHFYSEYGYPNGQSVVIPLLFSTLDAVDLNEGFSCWSTVSMLRQLVSMIPLVDCSRATPVRGELDRQIREDTAQLEDFVLLFLSKVFTLIEASSVECTRLEYRTPSDSKNSLESELEEGLSDVVTVMLRQCSRAIFGSALNKLASFVLLNSLEGRVAGNLLATVCRAFAQIDGQRVLSKLLPELLSKLDQLIGDQESLSEDELSDELAHSLVVLQAILATQGNHLLPYLGGIIQLLDKLLSFKSHEAQRLSSQLLATILASLFTVQCVKLERDLDDPEYPYWDHWAESVDLSSARAHWYLPGELENQAAQALITRYLDPSVSFIQNCLASRQLSSRDELRKHLRIIMKILEGAQSAIPMWRAESAAEVGVSEIHLEPTLGAEYEIKMPNGENVRLVLLKMLTALQTFILDTEEDDIISLELLQKIWRLLAKDNLTDSHNLHIIKKYYTSMKIAATNSMIGDRGYLPEVLLKRLNIQQMIRKTFTAYPFTEATKEIMSNLFKLATSKYVKIRSLAQETLEIFFQEYPTTGLHTLLPQILEVLAKDPELNESAFKGSLFILWCTEQIIFSQNDWLSLSSLLPALVRSKSSENLTIIRKLESIIDQSEKLIKPINIRLEVPDTCAAAASELWLNGIKPLDRPATENEIKKGLEDLRRIGENNEKVSNVTLDKLIDAAQDNRIHWRHRLMAEKFILALLHPQNKFSAKIIDYFLKGLISDSIDERKSAITIMTYVFKLIKRKPSKQIEKSSIEKDVRAMPGVRADNKCVLYGDLNDLPCDENRWEKTRFLDKPCVSYFVWPEKYAFHAASSEEPWVDRKKWPLTESERAIESFINDNANLKKLVRFLSLEENKENDKFRTDRYRLFKGIFRQFGNAQLDACLECVSVLVREKEENKQRCAAEIFCGIVCGSKHWPFRAIEDMWQKLRPILREILQNVTEDTIQNWCMCLNEIFRKHDPRRLHWLLEFLVEESFAGESRSSFHDSARLMLLESAIGTGHRWRLANLFDRLIPKIEKRLFNEPYDNVRSCLVNLLIAIFDSEEDANNLKIDAFVARIRQQLNQRGRLLDTEEQKALSAVCQWVIEYETSMHCGLVSSMYELYPILSLHVEQNEANPELAAECRRAVAALAQMFVLPRQIPAALTIFQATSNSPSGLMRAGVSSFFLHFLYLNIPLLIARDGGIDKFRDITLLLIKDPQLEVRERASLLLNLMILCGVLQDAPDYLNQFRRLAKTKLLKKKNNLENSVISARNSDALRLRHAGILGLCSFVQAHPRDIPKFVGTIFEDLSGHLEDPHPVPATIRKTISAFRRTHCDAWTGLQGIARYFTEEQFSILQNLTVPPTHYA